MVYSPWLRCDAGWIRSYCTIKKLSIILKKNQMDGQKFPLSTPLQVKSHPSLAQNPISRFTQIIEQQPPLTSLVFYSMSFWPPMFPPHNHIYRNKLSQIVMVTGQLRSCMPSKAFCFWRLFATGTTSSLQVTEVQNFDYDILRSNFQSIRSFTILRLPRGYFNTMLIHSIILFNWPADIERNPSGSCGP